MTERLGARDAALLLAVALLWAANFVISKIGLASFPPLLFSVLRFAMLAALIPFVAPPAAPWRVTAGLGLTLGLFTFLLTFLALAVGLGAGLASVILPSQVFFTVIAAAVLFRERVAPIQMAGLVLGAAGLVWLALARVDGFSPLGFLICLGAAMGQAVANFIQRAARGADALSMVVWMSLAPIAPLLALSFAFEGGPAILSSLASAGAGAWLAVAYTAFGSTALAYAIWGAMLAKLPAARVAPFALLVPAFGLAGGAAVLDERIGASTLAGAGLMVAGLALTVAGPAFVIRRRRR